ncbi:hypothetical protein ACHAXT_005496 [Thalassiosira profunda]
MALDSIDEGAPLAAEAMAAGPIPNGDVLPSSPSRRGTKRSLEIGTPSRDWREVCSKTGQKFTVVEMSRDARESNDVVHNNISIPPAVQVILDSPPVQRLIDLRQLGLSFNAYPNCTHTRKEHSLGVMEIAGRFVVRIQQNQRQLEITEKDVLCVRIAGLCHDLGHGPFSHAYEVFLEAVIKEETDHPEKYEERNTRFKAEFGVDMPPIPVKYKHESTSLMMVDFALASVGLEIDWDNLDEPLKQVRDGIDAELFGVDLGSDQNGKRKVEPFTSRDWVFIKEMIWGKPLVKPDAPEDQKDFVGRERNKEFLYDIVNNRHNGLDVDKIDYYDRDSKQAYGTSDGNLNIFERDAVVARGVCPDPEKCFQCEEDSPGEHLMLCYPKKHVSAAMNFFGTRMKNHETVYTHKKTKATELKMVQILIEADRHFCMLQSTQRDDPYAFPVPSRFEGFEYKKLPISRAWMYPRLFLRMDDSIARIIEDRLMENDSPKLDVLRKHVNDWRKHKVFKCVGEVEIGTVGGDQFWKLDEDDMKAELLEVQRHNKENVDDPKAKAVLNLDAEDFIVEKRLLHYGRQENNPVTQMRFLMSKGDQAKLTNPIEGLPLAKEVTSLPMNTPQNFLRQTIRFFCTNDAKHGLLTDLFENWKLNKREDTDGEGHNNSQSQTQSEPALLTQESGKRKYSDDGECPTSKKLFQGAS